MKKSKKVLLGAAALFVAGTLVGMLCAPGKSEKALRKLLRKSRAM